MGQVYRYILHSFFLCTQFIFILQKYMPYFSWVVWKQLMQPSVCTIQQEWLKVVGLLWLMTWSMLAAYPLQPGFGWYFEQAFYRLPGTLARIGSGALCVCGGRVKWETQWLLAITVQKKHFSQHITQAWDLGYIYRTTKYLFFNLSCEPGSSWGGQSLARCFWRRGSRSSCARQSHWTRPLGSHMTYTSACHMTCRDGVI